MKIFALAAAGLMAAAGANAQTVTTTRTVTRAHSAPVVAHHGSHQVCRTVVHAHRKVRTCRTTRY